MVSFYEGAKTEYEGVRTIKIKLIDLRHKKDSRNRNLT